MVKTSQILDRVARCITPEEAARRLGLFENPKCKNPERQVMELMRRGLLQGRLVGRVKQVVEESLVKFINEGRGA